MATYHNETIPVSSLINWIEKFDPQNPIVFKGIHQKDNHIDIICKILMNGIEIPLHREISKVSHEFNWGYGGAGPQQAAVAILHELYGMSELQMCGGAWPDMVKKIISRIGRHHSEWCLTDVQITLILSGKFTFEQLCPQYVD